MTGMRTVQFYQFQFEICDLKNAGIITLSCLITALFSGWWGSSQSFFAVVIIPFLLYSKTGITPTKRTLSLIPMGIASAIFIGITSLIDVGLWAILPWIFIATLILYLVPRYLPGSQLASIFILVFVLLAYSSPTHHVQEVYERTFAVLVGTIIMTCVNFIFDHDTHLTVPTLDKSLLLIQRSIRMAFTMTFLIFICHYLEIKNPAWVGFSLMAVEQNNLGTSLKKATQRVTGTLLGIILGLLLSHFLFIPYPHTRILSLALVFGLFASLRYNYTFAIILATILLADLFYFMAPGSISVEIFLLNRILDTLLGVLIGLASAQLIFPRSILANLHQELCHFWKTYVLFLKMAELKKLDESLLTDLHEDIVKLNQDIKDFRYEPISYLFRRYHLMIKLISVLKKLLSDLTYLSKAEKELPPDLFQIHLLEPLLASAQLISKDHDIGRPITQPQPYIEMDEKITLSLKHLEAYPEAKEILLATHFILCTYQKIAITPRWSLEIT